MVLCSRVAICIQFMPSPLQPSIRYDPGFDFWSHQFGECQLLIREMPLDFLPAYSRTPVLTAYLTLLRSHRYCQKMGYTSKAAKILPPEIEQTNDRLTQVDPQMGVVLSRLVRRAQRPRKSSPREEPEACPPDNASASNDGTGFAVDSSLWQLLGFSADLTDSFDLDLILGDICSSDGTPNFPTPLAGP
jgi:hypothetical protein